MMLQIGVGFTPRAVSAPQSQPMHSLTLVFSADAVTVPVKATAMTIEIEAPSAHVGSYRLDLTDLARGPVCLVAPVIRESANDSRLTIEPGLWVYDPALGPVTRARQWLVEETALSGETGLSLDLGAEHTERLISHAETVRQAWLESFSLSLPFRPSTAPAVPKALLLNPNQTISVMAEGDPVALGINGVTYEPIDPALTAAGPVGLGAPVITRSGSTMTVGGDWHWINDEAAGAIETWGTGWYKGESFAGRWTSYTRDTQGDSLSAVFTYRAVATDAHGTRVLISNPLTFGS